MAMQHIQAMGPIAKLKRKPRHPPQFVWLLSPTPWPTRVKDKELRAKS